MAFGDNIKGLFGNIGQGGGNWYLGKNLNMQPGQAAQILSMGGPAASALAMALRARGVSQAEIQQAAAQPTVVREYMPVGEDDLADYARKRGFTKKADMTPLLIGLGVLAVVLAIRK